MLALGVFALTLWPLYYSFRYFAAEITLLKAVIPNKVTGSISKEETLYYLDKSLLWNPRNIYAMHEKLTAIAPEDPGSAIVLAGEIESMIPGYRNVTKLKGIAQADLADWSGAAESFERYLTYDVIEPSTYVHLVAVKVMLSDRNGALQTFKEFFTWQHRKYMDERWIHLDLKSMELSFSDTVEINVSFPDEDRQMWIAQISEIYLTRLVDLLVDNKRMGYFSLLINLYESIGRIYDDMDYGDVELAYYMLAASSGKLHPETLGEIYAKNYAFYRKTKELKERAALQDNSSGIERADMLLISYIQNMLAIRYAAVLEEELRQLEK